MPLNEIQRKFEGKLGKRFMANEKYWAAGRDRNNARNRTSEESETSGENAGFVNRFRRSFKAVERVSFQGGLFCCSLVCISEAPEPPTPS